jgi:hypothetical protein
MTRTDTLLATYKGLINTVCRPDHLGQMQITRSLASIASEKGGMTNRERAAWLFSALVHILMDEGALSSDEAASYLTAARDWAFSYEDLGDLSVLMM